MQSDVVVHDEGGYLYLPSSLRFASAGVAGRAGYAIERGVLHHPVALPAGLQVVAGHLERLGRPMSALCGLELRMPGVLDPSGFREFNAAYLAALEPWGLAVHGVPPLARTNVVPVEAPIPATGLLVACSYTVENDSGPTSFVLSGVPELPEVYTYPDDIVRRGDTSRDGLVDKARCVVDRLVAYTEQLDARWDAGASVHLYTRHPAAVVLEQELLEPRHLAPRMGLVWHDAAPPVTELELEIDVRRYRAEVLVTSG